MMVEKQALVTSSIQIEEVTRNFRFMHFAMYIYEVA